MSDLSAIRTFMRNHELARVADAVAESLQPSIALRLERVGSDDAQPVGSSKMGGGADVPPGFTWPRQGEVDHRFIAQINLNEAAAIWPDAPLPKTGLLSFFWCQERDGLQPWTVEGAYWKAMHFDRTAETLRRVPDPWAAKPERVGLIGRVFGRRPSPVGQGFHPCRVAMRRVWTLPGLDSPFAPKVELTDEESDQLLGGEEEGFEELGVLTMEGNRLLGAPCAVQGPVELEIEAYRLNPAKPDWKGAERTAGDWRLLLQVDSDDAAGFMFGDAGSLYFMMRQADLAARRWDTVEVVTQCS